MKLESGSCWDLLFFFGGVYIAACKIAGQGEWRLLGFAGISSFAVSTAVWQSAGEKNDFWVGKMIFLKLETSDCWDLLGFLLFRVVYYLADCPEKKYFWVGEIIFLKIGEWRLLGFAGISSFTVSTAAWRAARKKNDFWVGKIIFLKLETSDCWDLGFLLLRCLLSKRLVVLAYIGGLSFFFLPYRFGGVGERGGMVLLHVNDPPFFTTPHGSFDINDY